MITMRLSRETMQQLIVKIWRRSHGPWCRKKLKNLKKMQIFQKIALIRDIEILKNIPINLQAMQ